MISSHHFWLSADVTIIKGEGRGTPFPITEAGEDTYGRKYPIGVGGGANPHRELLGKNMIWMGRSKQGFSCIFDNQHWVPLWPMTWPTILTNLAWFLQSKLTFLVRGHSKRTSPGGRGRGGNQIWWQKVTREGGRVAWTVISSRPKFFITIFIFSSCVYPLHSWYSVLDNCSFSLYNISGKFGIYCPLYPPRFLVFYLLSSYCITFFKRKLTYNNSLKSRFNIYRKKFVTIWPVTREGGRCTRLVTNGDNGGREGQKLPIWRWRPFWMAPYASFCHNPPPGSS